MPSSPFPVGSLSHCAFVLPNPSQNAPREVTSVPAQFGRQTEVAEEQGTGASQPASGRRSPWQGAAAASSRRGGAPRWRSLSPARPSSAASRTPERTAASGSARDRTPGAPNAGLAPHSRPARPCSPALPPSTRPQYLEVAGVHQPLEGALAAFHAGEHRRGGRV